ncbi:MAG: hypothetical protein JW751_26795 [Polyangiaceae bacterium]|nr:hypothetical protein [Polyangiaceae bacterium]
MQDTSIAQCEPATRKPFEARRKSTTSCTEINSDYVEIVLDAYAQYADAAGHPVIEY